MNRVTLGVIVFALTSHFLSGQNFFIGIYDEGTKQPIADVRITLESREYRTHLYTGGRGNASAQIPFGIYTLIIEKRGYEKQIESNIYIQELEIVNVEFYLIRDGTLSPQKQTQQTLPTKVETNQQPKRIIDPGFEINDDASTPLDHLGITSREYRRPSITYLYVNRHHDLVKELNKKLIASDLNAKFNDNRIKNCLIDAQGNIDDKFLKNYIEQNITGEIVRIWFPFNNYDRQHSLEVINDRGLYDATDADVLASRATLRGEGILRDAGELLINRSYIIVYDIVKVNNVHSRNLRGYEARLNMHLFKLKWNNNTMHVLLENWNNPDFTHEFLFPVEHIKSFHRKRQFLTLSATQRRRILFGRKSDDELLSELSMSAIAEVEFHMSKNNPDFLVKSEVASSRPIKAPIGLKEGVHVDQRYFIYELSLNQDNVIEKNRKTVVRATRRIADNRHVATGEAKYTDFYKVAGKEPMEGMLFEQNPDRGMSLGATYWPGDINVFWEGLVGVMAKSTSVRPGSKTYIKMMAVTRESDSNHGSLSSIIGAVGISRDFFLGNLFTINPYVGNSFISYWGGISYFGLDAGINLNLLLSNSFHLTANGGTNTWKGIIHNEWYGFSGGVKILF